MNIPVFIEPIADKGYFARAGSPFDWSAEGPTEEEALKHLHAVAMKSVADGCKIASISVPELNEPLAQAKANESVVGTAQGEHPLLKWAGTWDLNDPLIQEWQIEVEEYRREIENDPTR